CSSTIRSLRYVGGRGIVGGTSTVHVHLNAVRCSCAKVSKFIVWAITKYLCTLTSLVIMTTAHGPTIRLIQLVHVYVIRLMGSCTYVHRNTQALLQARSRSIVQLT